jgi:pimeloyl-ACP methyl ester carboxylesterase
MHRLLILLVCLLMVAPAAAQRDASAEIVSIQAADGLTLVGEFYASESSAPALLLLHMLGSRRSAWEPLMPTLVDAGYNVLAVDMRGHGDTGSAQDWTAAEQDVTAWLDWLNDQPSVSVNQISIIGASIGANLALIGCAYDERCQTVIALSPGLDYRGVMPELALSEALVDRTALLVASVDDLTSADSVRVMTQSAGGEIGIQLYDGSAHGTALFNQTDGRVIDLIAFWLMTYLPAG